MEQIQNNQVITNYHRENAQFPGIALDGSLLSICAGSASWTGMTA